MQSFPEHERRAGNQVEETMQKGNGFTSGSGSEGARTNARWKPPHSGEMESPSGNSTWLPESLEEPHLLSQSPKGFWAKMLSALIGPSLAR